jgi:hypothetical protein
MTVQTLFWTLWCGATGWVAYGIGYRRAKRECSILHFNTKGANETK